MARSPRYRLGFLLVLSLGSTKTYAGNRLEMLRDLFGFGHRPKKASTPKGMDEGGSSGGHARGWNPDALGVAPRLPKLSYPAEVPGRIMKLVHNSDPNSGVTVSLRAKEYWLGLSEGDRQTFVNRYLHYEKNLALNGWRPPELQREAYRSLASNLEAQAKIVKELPKNYVPKSMTSREIFDPTTTKFTFDPRDPEAITYPRVYRARVPAPGVDLSGLPGITVKPEYTPEELSDVWSALEASGRVKGRRIGEVFLMGEERILENKYSEAFEAIREHLGVSVVDLSDPAQQAIVRAFVPNADLTVPMVRNDGMLIDRHRILAARDTQMQIRVQWVDIETRN